MLDGRLRARLARQRLIFTVTTGRSGTGFLAQLLDALPGVTARHEPAPHFHDHTPGARHDPAAAAAFWRDEKLPTIARQRRSIYIETSHVFCKGFFEPLLALGVVPDLILLSRDPRAVATSLYQLGTVPGRTAWGRQFLLTPDESPFLPWPGWESRHDYQLCYWYCREIAQRQTVYAAQVRSRGGRAVACRLEDLKRPDGFEALCDGLGLPRGGWWTRRRIARLQARRVNAKAHQKQPLDLSASELAALEAAVDEELDAI